jgi:hypothetical protein
MRTAAGSFAWLGAARARRRTFASAIVASAHSTLLSLRHPGCARPTTPALGHGQPLAEFGLEEAAIAEFGLEEAAIA